MSTVGHHMTVEEFEAYAARHGRCELVRGEVRKLSPAGERHGAVTSRFHAFMGYHVYQHDLGEVYAAETGFRLDDDGRPTVRAPDIAFVAKARVQRSRRFSSVVPDLVVETLSPEDRAVAVAEKVQWWLGKGVRLVVVLDPQNRTVTHHRPGGQAMTQEATDTFEAPDILPGFSLPLRRLFDADSD